MAGNRGKHMTNSCTNNDWKNDWTTFVTAVDKLYLECEDSRAVTSGFCSQTVCWQGEVAELVDQPPLRSVHMKMPDVLTHSPSKFNSPVNLLVLRCSDEEYTRDGDELIPAPSFALKQQYLKATTCFQGFFSALVRFSSEQEILVSWKWYPRRRVVQIASQGDRRVMNGLRMLGPRRI